MCSLHMLILLVRSFKNSILKFNPKKSSDITHMKSVLIFQSYILQFMYLIYTINAHKSVQKNMHRQKLFLLIMIVSKSIGNYDLCNDIILQNWQKIIGEKCWQPFCNNI